MFRYLGEKPSRRWHRIVWLYSSIARHKVKIQFKTSRWLIDWWRQWYHSRCVRVKHQKSMHDGSKHAKDFQHGRQSKGSRTLKMSDRSNQTGLSVVQMKRDFFYTFHMQSHKDLWRFLVGELPWNVSGLSTEQGTEIKPVRCDTNWSISLQYCCFAEEKERDMGKSRTLQTIFSTWVFSLLCWRIVRQGGCKLYYFGCGFPVALWSMGGAENWGKKRSVWLFLLRYFVPR